MTRLEVVKFSESYGFAAFAWALVMEQCDPEEFDPALLLDPADREVELRLTSPQRDTLLHLFLRRLYTEAYIEDFEHHRSDMLDLVASDYEAVLRLMGVLFEEASFPHEAHEAYERLALERISYLRGRLPIARIAQDTFQLLFRDRSFLLRFNQIVARSVSRLETSRRVQRAIPPAWLKRGVFYRDNGRCVACSKDLTGVFMTNGGLHFDHIVPLAANGSNDPSNFQVLCADCNRCKSQAASTSERYPVFWAVE